MSAWYNNVTTSRISKNHPIRPSIKAIKRAKGKVLVDEPKVKKALKLGSNANQTFKITLPKGFAPVVSTSLGKSKKMNTKNRIT